MRTDLKPGKRRVFAVAGVNGFSPQRWVDVSIDDTRVDSLIAAGLVQLTNGKGEGPPALMPRPVCCGERI